MSLVCYNFLLGKKVIKRNLVIKMKLYDEFQFPLKDQNFFVHFIRTVLCILRIFSLRLNYCTIVSFGNILIFERKERFGTHRVVLRVILQARFCPFGPFRPDGQNGKISETTEFLFKYATFSGGFLPFRTNYL